MKEELVRNVLDLKRVSDRVISPMNREEQTMVDFAKRMKMARVNTFFQKRQEHKVTYKSGRRSTQADYISGR